jgi:hypothetical protein
VTWTNREGLDAERAVTEVVLVMWVRLAVAFFDGGLACVGRVTTGATNVPE